MRYKAFAEFYHRVGESFVAACGDRAVLILDGRLTSRHHHGLAIDWARRHGFDGYRLCRGEIGRPFYLTARVAAVADKL